MEQYRINIEGSFTIGRLMVMVEDMFISSFFDKIYKIEEYTRDGFNGIECWFKYDKKVENPEVYFDKYRK